MAIWDRDIWSDRDPFGEFERLRRRMNRLFSAAAGQGLTGGFPPVNVWSNSERAVVSAELPGVNREDLDISVENDVLTIKGHREPEKLGEGEMFRRNERGCGRFHRSIGLPFAVEPEKISAEYKDGVLRIELTRHESSRPRQIEIK